MTKSSNTYSFQQMPECIMCGKVSTVNRVIGQRLNQPTGFRTKKRLGSVSQS